MTKDVGTSESAEMTTPVESVYWPVELRLVRLSGSDAVSWLQTQITQDVRLIDATGARFCLVQQTGRVEDFGVAYLRDGDLFLALHHPEILASRIESFVVMEDVVFENLDLVGVRSVGMDAVGEDLRFTDDWIEESGLLTFCESLAAFESGNELTDSQAAELEIRAIRPSLSSDVDDKTFPQELGTEFESGHVSYSKGCYLGQEVVHRIMARGRTNRTLRFFRCDSPLESEQSLVQAEKAVGRVNRAVRSEDGYLASGFVRNAYDRDLPVFAGETAIEFIDD